MKVIVVEDEPNSLMGMKKAVESLDMEIALFTSSHAEEAMEIIAEHRPDLIVTDIMLPGMTGLDLVEHFAGEHYHPKVIVVSGYSDFEYAQRSIRFGAADYLLKPFDTEEFAEKVRKSLLLIRQEKDQVRYLHEQHTFAQMGNQLMRDNYLNDFCLKHTPLEEHLYQRLKLWNLAWLADYSYWVIVIDAKGFPDGRPAGKNDALQTFAIGNILGEMLAGYDETAFFKDSKQRWVVMTANAEVRESIHSVAEVVKRYQYIDLAIGISAAAHLFEQIHFGYQEAVRNFRMDSLSERTESPGDPDSSLSNGVTPDEMATLICRLDEESVARAVNRFVRDTVMLDGTQNRGDITRGVLNYLSQIHDSLSVKTGKELEEIPMSVWESFDECATLQEYQQVLRNYLTDLSRRLFAPKTNALVERAMEKMAVSYMEDITLSRVAEELSIHPVWLSQVFKKETGHTFTDYLAELRITRAKTLLRETSMKIYEIAAAVGYHDLQYFGTLFKKKTGETPKEFRYGK
ncbi:response regulator [Cohnella yongneupensis]|uniref:Response regulator n=1 Tax=Cohnella yongneupensis TaxID=425006 RepID=A0ABW0QVK0_9BACL